MIFKRALCVLGLVGITSMPLVAQAQSQDETIRGTVASLDGKYTLYLHDARGYVDTVRLHDGTIINPTGLELQPGISVEIHGRADGHVFDANEIDTPNEAGVGDAGPPPQGPPPGTDYGYDDAAPAAAPIYVAPYPYYAYYPGYALSYPAFVSLGFGFGYGCCYAHGWYGYPGYYGRGYYGWNGYYHGGGYYHPGYGTPTGTTGYGYGYRGFTGSTRYTPGTSANPGTGSYGGYVRGGGSSPSGYRAPSAVRGGGNPGGSYHGGGGAVHAGGGSTHI